MVCADTPLYPTPRRLRKLGHRWGLGQGHRKQVAELEWTECGQPGSRAQQGAASLYSAVVGSTRMSGSPLRVRGPAGRVRGAAVRSRAGRQLGCDPMSNWFLGLVCRTHGTPAPRPSQGATPLEEAALLSGLGAPVRLRGSFKLCENNVPVPSFPVAGVSMSGGGSTLGLTWDLAGTGKARDGQGLTLATAACSAFRLGLLSTHKPAVCPGCEGAVLGDWTAAVAYPWERQVTHDMWYGLWAIPERVCQI